MALISADRACLDEFRASYDQDTYVLYMTLQTVQLDCEEVPGGLELDCLAEDGRPSGVTVFGLVRNGWLESLDGLSRITATHLSIEQDHVANCITHALVASPARVRST